MIQRFAHKGLKRLFQDGDRSKVRADLVDKAERILRQLDRATVPSNMDLPGYRLHPLGGDRKSEWAVWVTGNWRIVFRFDGANATDVDLPAYH